ALDTLTGEVAWTHSGLRAGTIILGGEKIVYLRPPEGQNPIALRAVDGKRIDTKNLADTLNKFLHLVDDQFVMAAQLPGGKTGLRLFDPVAGRDLWMLELQGQAKISILDGDRAAVLEQDGKDGKFGLIDLQTGRRNVLATIAAEDINPRTDAFA